MSRFLLASFLFVALVAAVSAVAAYAWWGAVHEPLGFGESEMVYEVKPGASLRSVSKDMEEQGVVTSRWLLESWARYTGKQRALKAGEYSLSPDMSVETLFDTLVSGQSLQYRITFPEGMTVAEMVTSLKNHDRVRSELDASRLQEELRKITGMEQSEGWFYPDTYQFPKGATDVDVLRIAHNKMKTELESAWASRHDDLPLESPYQALILASIVEKETGVPDERPLIASVFTQRLIRGMRLQTDPTVIYGMGDRYKGNIRKSDLRRDTPYNTYTRKGLPPTPIASPGRGALMAAVQPIKSDALFFVAKGGGRHHFSATYKEHRQAVIKYQLGGKASRYQGDK